MANDFQGFNTQTYGALVAYLNKHGGGGGGTTNYNNLSNKPSINDIELKGSKSLEDLGIQKILNAGANIEIEEDGTINAHVEGGGVSQITFNGAVITPDQTGNVNLNEGDPTVPDWAKSQTKPSYTPEETGALGVDDDMELEDIDSLFNVVFG